MYRLAQFFGAVNTSGDFESVIDFAFDELGIEFVVEFASGVVAVFLQHMEVTGEAAEIGNGAVEFFGVGGELLLDFRLEKEFGKLSSGKLKTDFGNLSGFVSAKVISQIILAEAFLESAFVFKAPFNVAAARFPVGDISRSNTDAVFVEGSNNFGMWNVVLEHEVDHVAQGLCEASDFAVASEFAFGLGNGSGIDAGLRVFEGGWGRECRMVSDA